MQLGYDQWRTTIQAVKRRHALRVIFNADAETPQRLWAKTFYREYVRKQASYRVKSLTVYPGYDDAHLGRTNGTNSGRFDGKLYSALWKRALASSPDWIFITSWNEWHEGSELEHSREFGTLYRVLTATYTKKFL